MQVTLASWCLSVLVKPASLSKGNGIHSMLLLSLRCQSPNVLVVCLYNSPHNQPEKYSFNNSTLLRACTV